MEQTIATIAAVAERNGSAPVAPVTTARERFEALIRDAFEFSGEVIELPDDAGYAELLEHVEAHKWLANQRIPYEMTMRDALFSWYEHVYEPMMLAIEREGIDRAFPDRTRAELFLWVARHWHFRKQEKRREVSVEEAIRSFGATFAGNRWQRLRFRVRLAGA